MSETSVRSEVTEKLRREGTAFLLLLIDLFFVALYAILIGAAAVFLHVWIHHVEAHHMLSIAEIIPFKMLAWWLTWLDVIGAGWAATMLLAESVIGRGKVLWSILNALRD